MFKGWLEKLGGKTQTPRKRKERKKKKKRNDRRWQIKPLISARATYPVRRHWYETKASLEGAFWPLELAWRAIRRWPLWALERDLKPFHIYTLCSHEKSYIFSMWDLKPISIYTLCSKKKKLCFFNMGYKSLITMKPGTRPLDRINPQTGFNNYEI
jgi:hypothetical protein